MPRELKKRGRREENKRKVQEEISDQPSKRNRTAEDVLDSAPVPDAEGDVGDDFIRFDGQPSFGQPPQSEDQFYGLLEEDEQAYYSNVNSKLIANDFESDEDRVLFIQAVHRESVGKEMKVASSQSCSRYLEKVIMLSQPDQLRSLFTAFLENLTYLVQHRFGSHCCEALFVRCSKFLKPDRDIKDESANMEDLFLQSVQQLSPNLGFLVTDRFASHCVRVLLLILAGEEVDETSKKVLASRRKEKIELPTSWNKDTETKPQLPKSFRKAREDLITAAFSGLDTTYVRALATHPIGNPFLQLVLKIELTLQGKSKDNAHQLLFPNLFPDQSFQADSETGKFVQGLLYDASGSHLIEILIQHLPGQQFKKLYRNILKEKMPNLAKNDIASYVAVRVIERLGKDDLLEVFTSIQPELSILVGRSRLGFIKTLFERFTVRKVDSQSLVTSLKTIYGNDTITFLPKLLQFNPSIDDIDAKTNVKDAGQGRADLHGSLLVQAMVKDPKAASALHESFLAQPTSSIILMAKNNIASRALQAILISDQAPVQFRKPAVQHFLGNISELAQTSAGSHLVDALWDATSGLHFLKEKIANELVQEEGLLRESLYGRTVWRNWSMDTYMRRRAEWNALAKGQTSSTTTASVDQANVESNTTEKTPIQLARERYAKSKTRKNENDALRPSPLVVRT